ncbi:MAG: hypothetical protein ACU0BS_08565 [Hasllibacter sp.]
MTLSARFFATSAALGLAGMAWGIQMSASGDHSLSAAHGHLNLIGFVAMAVFGAFYAVTPGAGDSRLAEVHYWVTLAAALVLTPGIVLAVTGRGEGLAQAGSLLAVGAMGLFAWIALRAGTAPAGRRATPAG